MALHTETPASDDPATDSAQPIAIARPSAEDGARVHDLIAACPPLDANSLYCNLLQCTHFAATCSLATVHGRAVGWVSGYKLPEAPTTLFVWQVAVHEDMRGRRLAKALILDILSRPECACATHIHTSVTTTNDASRRMFAGLADSLDAAFVEKTFFDRDRHFAGRNPTEKLLVIGPFAPRAAADGN